jgi:hypothetical protein
MTELKRLVLDFRTDGFVVRALYRTEGEYSPNPKGRRREVTQLTREGLQGGAEALEGRVDVVGTSGITTREVIFLCSAKDAVGPDEHKTAQKGADLWT